MALESTRKPILLVEDDAFMPIIVRERFKDQLEVVILATTLTDALDALEALARLDTRAGIISDLKLTENGLEGMQVLEQAISRGFRDLILFTSTPEEVPAGWLKEHPQVQLVSKKGLQPIVTAVDNWNRK